MCLSCLGYFSTWSIYVLSLKVPLEQFHRSSVLFLPDLTVPDPTSYAVLHLTQGLILYLYVKIYRIQSNKYGSMQHETGKWGSQVGRAEGRKAQCRSAGSMSRSHRMCSTPTSSLSWSVRSSNSSQGSSPLS